MVNVLIRSWNAETDKELKLRYGYQLVRFAHYNRKYDDALTLFDKYVETLDYKPKIYYDGVKILAGYPLTDREKELLAHSAEIVSEIIRSL